MAQKKGGWSNPRSRKTKCDGFFVVYVIRYPNGKVYIGQDLTDDMHYLGSGDRDLISQEQRQWRVSRADDERMVTTKEILWDSETATDSEVDYWETEFILKHDSWNPTKGYNKVLPVTPTYEQRKRHDYCGGCKWPPTPATK